MPSFAQTDDELWRHLNSRWRYMHAVLFFVGRPIYILRRIAPALLANLALATFVAMDHALSLNMDYHVEVEKATGTPVPPEYRWRRILPVVSGSNESIL